MKGKRKYSTWIAAAILTMAAAVLGYSFWGSKDAALEHTWTSGERQTRDVQILSRVTMEHPALPGPQTFEQEIRGSLHSRIFEVSDGDVYLGFQFDPVNLNLSGKSDEAINKALEQVFLAKFSLEGEPLTFEFLQSLTTEQKEILKEVIRTFQIILPKGHPKAWTVSEQNATGKYTASYSQISSDETTKRKTAFTSLSANILASEARFTFRDNSSWIASVEFEERLIITLSEVQRTTAAMRASIKLSSMKRNPNLRLDAFESLEEFKVFLHKSPAIAVAPTLEPSQVKDPMEKEKNLRAFLDAFTDLSQGRIAQLHELRDLIRDNPEMISLLLKILKEEGLEDRTSATILHAFELAGTPQAQEALVEVLNDPEHEQMTRVRAVVAMGGLENPTKLTLEELFDCSENREDETDRDLSNTAYLSLGVIGNRLHENQTEDYTELKLKMLESLEKAESAEEKGMLLKALGNTKDTSFFDAASANLSADAPFVRGSAAQALGQMKTEKSQKALLNHLPGEKNQIVRTALIKNLAAFPDRNENTLSTFQKLVQKESDERARYEMARYLGAHMEDYPPARESLEKLLRDPSMRIREYAARQVSIRR